MKRCALLVDTDNLLKSARKSYSGNINYQYLAQLVSENKEVVKKIGYLSVFENQKTINSFIKALKLAGFEVKPLLAYIHNGRKKVQTAEVPMTIDAITLSPKIDTIALVTGNGEILPLVQYLKSIGVTVEIYYFSMSTAKKLKEEASFFFELEKVADKLIVKTGPPKKENIESFEEPRLSTNNPLNL